MGYLLNQLDEPVFMAVPKPMLTEFGIHHRLESCGAPREKNGYPQKWTYPARLVELFLAGVAKLF